MVNVVSCPHREELRQLLLGQVSGSQAESLERHLDECPSCLELLDSLKAEDTLLDAARSPAASADGPDAAVRGLIDRLRGLRPEAATADTKDSGSDPPSGSDAATSAERLDFLAPPQGPGELGRLGPYRVLRVLGAGGMGVVFQAEDPHLERLVALKAMRPALAASASARQRFLREAKAAAALKHDHVITIHQVGEDRGVPFLAMEFLEGESLEARLQRQGRLPVAEAVRVGREVAEGLAAAHERGLIHRDIKPGNLWLESRGDGRPACPPDNEATGGPPRVVAAGGPPAAEKATGGPPVATDWRVKVLDFGLARAAGTEANLTRTGVVVGTPAYMAPEQARGEAVDHRADLFSLGCVLYRMLTGDVPFPGKDSLAVLAALALERPRPPRERNPDVPPALSGLVLRLLAKDPAGRPPSARAVVDALRAVESAPAAAPRTTRRRAAALVAAAVLFLAGGGLLAQQIIIRIKSKDGETEIKAPPGAGVVVEMDGKKVAEVPMATGRGIPAPVAKVPMATGRAGPEVPAKPPEGNAPKPEPAAPAKPEPVAAKSEPAPTRSGEPMSPLALVGRPAEIKGLRTWTVETRGHRGPVQAVAFSPDGKRLASAGADGTVRVWFMADGRLARALVGHTAPVQTLAWSRDGKTLVSAGDDKAVRFWDAETGQCRVLPGHTGAVFAAAWSPDGKTLATAGRDNAVRLWDGGSGELLYTLRGHEGLSGVAWLPDSKRLLTGGTDKQLLLWNAETGTQLAAVQPEADPPLRLTLEEIHSLALSPDGKVLMTAEGGGLLRGWECHLGGAAPYFLGRRPVFEWKGLAAALAWAPDGKRFADTGGNQVRVWQPQVQKPVRLLEGQPGNLQALAWAADGKTMAGGDNQGNVVFWNANSEQLVHTWPSATGPDAEPAPWESGTAWSADGKAVAACDRFGKVRLWRLDPGRLAATFQERALVGALACSPDGKTLAATGKWTDQPTTVRLWDVAGGEVRLELRGHTTSVSMLAQSIALAWSPDGKALASLGNDWTLRLWDPVTGKETRSLPASWAMVWSPDGKRLAYSTDGQAVRVVEAATGKEVHTYATERWVNELAFAPDGKTLAVYSQDANAVLSLWDVESGRPLGPLPELPPQGSGLAWLADGKTLVIKSIIGGPQLTSWDTVTRRRRVAALPADGALSPDRRLLASTAANPARLWDVEGGRPVGALLLLRDGGWLAVGPGGHYHASPGVGRDLVYVVQTDQGQEVVSPEEFEKKYGWTNDPDRVRLPGS
jgi:WD40 repeat protein/serine/threonine protein kinase